MSRELIGARVATLYELQSAWLEPRLRDIGVRWTSFQFLAAIVGAGEEASQAEVARRLGLSPATLSETVQNHINIGWIEQTKSERDKRLKVLRLTNDGKKLMMKIRALVVECETLVANSVSIPESKKCAKALDKMIDALENALQEQG
ncbi:MAG: winged helix-turn-helix transcriptional regulator [Armatimonadetes bacterium]|nr:winged helix-turn-helix transcriptional regulator [Armatimonadota bacterium]